MEYSVSRKFNECFYRSLWSECQAACKIVLKDPVVWLSIQPGALPKICKRPIVKPGKKADCLLFYQTGAIWGRQKQKALSEKIGKCLYLLVGEAEFEPATFGFRGHPAVFPIFFEALYVAGLFEAIV